MNDLNDHINDLKQILSLKQKDYVFQAEESLARIAAINDPSVIDPLFLLLDDSAEYDELMYSIVHTVEQWDDKTYVAALLRSADALLQRAPQWSQILHIRVLNSPGTLNEYCILLDSATDSQRATVRAIYESIAKNWTDLADRVTPIIDRLK